VERQQQILSKQAINKDSNPAMADSLCEFVVQTMYEFEMRSHNFYDKQGCSNDQELFDAALSDPWFCKQVTQAMKEHWLNMAALPFESSRSVEALLECILHFVDAKKRAYVQTALLGLGLKNRRGRKLWIFFVELLIFNLEVMCKFRKQDVDISQYTLVETQRVSNGREIVLNDTWILQNSNSTDYEPLPNLKISMPENSYVPALLKKGR